MSKEITLINNDTMTNLANAVRNLMSISSAFTPIEMISNINNYKEDIIIHGNTHVNDLSITELIDDKVKYVGYRAFRSCYNLSKVSLPNCEYIEGPAFEMCSALQTVSMPKCSNIGYYAFYSCPSLYQTSFPECATIERNAFAYCSLLTQVSFPKCTSIGNMAFAYCSLLISLYLNQVTSVITLASSNAFDGTLLSAGGNGTIYVPNSLVTAFKNAENWSYVSNRIVGI